MAATAQHAQPDNPTIAQVIDSLAQLASVPLTPRSGRMLLGTKRADRDQVRAALSRKDRDLALQIVTASLNCLLMDKAIGPVLKPQPTQALLNARGEAVFDRILDQSPGATETLRTWIDEAIERARQVSAGESNVAAFPGRRAPTLAPPATPVGQAFPVEEEVPTRPADAIPQAARSTETTQSAPVTRPDTGRASAPREQRTTASTSSTRSIAGPHRMATSRDSVRPASRSVEGPTDRSANAPPTQGTGDQLVTARDNRGAFRQVKVHGGAHALTIVAVEVEFEDVRRPTQHSVMFELASKVSDKRLFNWDRKLVIKLTHHELVMVSALLRGYVKSIFFSNHGPRQDKYFGMQHQDKHVYLVAGAKHGPNDKPVVHSLPIGPDSLFKVGAIIFQQLRHATGNLDAGVTERLIASTAKMCLADPAWVQKNAPRKREQ